MLPQVLGYYSDKVAEEILDYGFMPIVYIALMVIYLILGRYNTRLMGWDYSVAMHTLNNSQANIVDFFGNKNN